ncbi:cytochrome c3 family protein [Pseudomonas sp. EL_65y_Pfl2_R95]|uniref:cytochrome c3 family protein n=1 Tax=Pseudomonas sp. EL_65y_Pfl2_R95 TaxID=3088698 RepID=UPI0030D92D54
MTWRWGLLLTIPLLIVFIFGISLGHDHLARKHPVLPINFEHNNHGSVNCVVCHHDFTDKSAAASATGSRTCVLCHKETPRLAVNIERDFHKLCVSCHLKQLQSFHPSGPVRSCKACHVVGR